MAEEYYDLGILQLPFALRIGVGDLRKFTITNADLIGGEFWINPNAPYDLDLAGDPGGYTHHDDTAILAIGGDTGPSHLAASFGVPTVAVFLASNWRRNGPLGARTTVVSGAAPGPDRPSGSARLPSPDAVGSQ